MTAAQCSTTSAATGTPCPAAHLVLAVGVQVLAHGHGLLDQVVQILGQLRGQTCTSERQGVPREGPRTAGKGSALPMRDTSKMRQPGGPASERRGPTRPGRIRIRCARATWGSPRRTGDRPPLAVYLDEAQEPARGLCPLACHSAALDRPALRQQEISKLTWP
jgi:hypothetical protein